MITCYMIGVIETAIISLKNIILLVILMEMRCVLFEYYL